MMYMSYDELCDLFNTHMENLERRAEQDERDRQEMLRQEQQYQQNFQSTIPGGYDDYE